MLIATKTFNLGGLMVHAGEFITVTDADAEMLMKVGLAVDDIPNVIIADIEEEEEEEEEEDENK